MSEKSLEELVAGLRSELAQPHNLDEPTRRALHELAQALEAAVDRPAGVESGPIRALRGRFADRVRELEASHPKLAATLENIVDTLAFYGL
jgi:lipopolysaccharide biosynthesis regulator YciM